MLVRWGNGTTINLADVSSIIVHNHVPISYTIVFKNGAVCDVNGVSGLVKAFDEYRENTKEVNENELS